VTDATLYTSINPFDVLNRVESKKDSGKSKDQSGDNSCK
jgi:hypothetical protein